jgi:hypothetical protein
MKIWLDDERPAPEGWRHVKTFDEFRVAFETGPVEAVSFDNDLGWGQREGWEIANWLRDEVVAGRITAPISLRVHTANPAARPRIEATLREIRSLAPTAREVTR